MGLLNLAATPMDRVVVCITSFNRVDCARILQEIIRLNWPKKWYVVHATADQTYQQYLEDILVVRDAKGLTLGALDLIKSSVQAAMSILPGGIDYIVHLEADTWISNQGVIDKYLHILSVNPKSIIAASSWSYDKVPLLLAAPFFRRRVRGLILGKLRSLGFSCGIGDCDTVSTQFFIAKATQDFVNTIAHIEANDDDFLEKLVYTAIVKRFGKMAIIPMLEREPVHPAYRCVCEELSLATHHWPSSDTHPASLPGKKEWLAEQKFINVGPNMQRLLEDRDLAYYNENAPRL